MDKAGSIIKFHCNNCGRKFSVPQIQAGKKGKCPKCKNIIVIPDVQTTNSITKQSNSGDIKTGSKSSAQDLILQDVTEKEKIQDQPISQSGTSPTATEYAQELEEESPEETESATQPRLPWPIDTFLYPISASSMVHLAILSFLPRMLLPLGHLNWLHPPIFGLGFLVIFLIACLLV